MYLFWLLYPTQQQSQAQRDLRTGQLRAGQLRTGQLQTGQLRTGQLQMGQLKMGQLKMDMAPVLGLVCPLTPLQMGTLQPE